MGRPDAERRVPVGPGGDPHSSSSPGRHGGIPTDPHRQLALQILPQSAPVAEQNGKRLASLGPGSPGSVQREQALLGLDHNGGCGEVLWLLFPAVWVSEGSSHTAPSEGKMLTRHMRLTNQKETASVGKLHFSLFKKDFLTEVRKRIF